MLAHGGSRVLYGAGQPLADAEDTCDGVSELLTHGNITRELIYFPGLYPRHERDDLKVFAVLRVTPLADCYKCMHLEYLCRFLRSRSENGSTHLVHSVLMEGSERVAILSASAAYKLNRLVGDSLFSVGLNGLFASILFYSPCQPTGLVYRKDVRMFTSRLMENTIGNNRLYRFCYVACTGLH
jgi:hypothetical protein